MTDLKNGIIEFEEMTITLSTTKDDLMKVYGAELSPMSSCNILDFNRLFKIDQIVFMAVFYFDSSEKLSRIELVPKINYKSEKWDRTGRQEERREFCDKWLYERLGEPYQNNGGAEYRFEHLRISCVTHFDIHNGADAGHIAISYLR